eukprot:TRINITY_DN4209_c0_g1_i3.p2 TRINITY_DN4209_c0_g1~~TRINITY_DN4209_c0_g1_i3.p2  ORF type:complete len:176 (+),score=27.48 TRINITY_DN4209_c0_g1_i3:749-1276(+)
MASTTAGASLPREVLLTVFLSALTTGPDDESLATRLKHLFRAATVSKAFHDALDSEEFVRLLLTRVPGVDAATVATGTVLLGPAGVRTKETVKLVLGLVVHSLLVADCISDLWAAGSTEALATAAAAMRKPEWVFGLLVRLLCCATRAFFNLELKEFEVSPGAQIPAPFAQLRSR